MPKKQTSPLKKADHYDDPKHNYLDYWQDRIYENAAEEIAIKRLLNGKHFKLALDVGGGYGRLTKYLSNYAERVALLEPSKQQLKMAEKYLKKYPNIELKLMQADDIKYSDGSVDLITMVRVMHHLPDPTAEFAELARVLSPNGLLILEVANQSHARNRIKYWLKAKSVPKQPVSIRRKLLKSDPTPFVNHHPKTVIKQLAHAGLIVDKILSVSNLRSPTLKKIVPNSVMLAAETAIQPWLSKVYFGPSIFMLIKKAK